MTVESDSLLAIQAIHDWENSCAKHSNNIREILSLRHNFMSCTFNYVSKLGNVVAHKLARYTRQVENICIWWDSSPNFILSPLWVYANP